MELKRDVYSVSDFKVGEQIEYRYNFDRQMVTIREIKDNGNLMVEFPASDELVEFEKNDHPHNPMMLRVGQESRVLAVREFVTLAK